MPKLKCKVEQCAYNYDWLCSKNYIDVDGTDAVRKSDTCCKSFLFKDVETLNYEFARMDGYPQAKTEVYCDVVSCVFEKGQRCYADRIEIINEGEIESLNYKDGSRPQITLCKTFECKD